MALEGSGNVTLGELAEFERRLAEMKLEIESKAVANAELDPGDTVVSSGVPKLSGFTVTSTTSKVVLGWNNAPITNLKRYEVQVSTNDSFANAETFFTRETTWTYTAGTAGVTYFFRVRARNFIEEVGEYTTTTTGTSSTPGLTDTVDLAPNSVTVLASAYTAAGFTLTSTATFDIVQSVTLTVTANSTVLILCTSHSDGNAQYIPALDRDGEGNIMTWLETIVGSSVAFIFEDLTPPTGSVTYNFMGKKVAATTLSNRSMFVLAVKK